MLCDVMSRQLLTTYNLYKPNTEAVIARVPKIGTYRASNCFSMQDSQEHGVCVLLNGYCFNWTGMSTTRQQIDDLECFDV